MYSNTRAQTLARKEPDTKGVRGHFVRASSTLSSAISANELIVVAAAWGLKLFRSAEIYRNPSSLLVPVRMIHSAIRSFPLAPTRSGQRRKQRALKKSDKSVPKTGRPRASMREILFGARRTENEKMPPELPAAIKRLILLIFVSEYPMPLGR